MAINKKLIHFNRKEVFEEKLANNEILDTSIVFIKDSKEIWTHGQFYGGESMVNITHADLVELRDNACLIPGMQYRITDYVTTTNQADTKSARHQFDIIVTADSENTLNEKARAIQHEGDTYFSDSNLAAWEIWYSLDNDTERFAWADTTNGKGVIYRMIDEFNNDCPYDFKNIMFKRNLIFDNGFAEYSDDGEETWVYTFAGQSHHVNNDEWSSMLDGSLESPFGHMSDENMSIFHDNIIKPYIMLYNGNEIYTECGLRYLNNIVFLGYWDKIGSANEEDIPYYFAYCCFSNSFGDACYNNSFGKSCNNNSLGDECYNNSFSGDCRYNSFSNNCNNNNFGNGCNNNSFSGGCRDNSFGNDCYNNSFVNECHDNSFGDSCNNNSFDNSCGSNIFGNNCNNNSFGNECCFNSFSDGCNNNSFGNNCRLNSFGSDCFYNSFGNNCYDNSFGNDCSSNSFGNNCYDNSFGNDCSSNSFGNECKSNSFDNNCYDNSFGNSCTNNGFGFECGHNSFGDDCNSNSFLNECYSNSFANNFNNNSFGYDCDNNSFGNNCYNNSFGNFYYYNSFGNGCQNNSFRLKKSKIGDLLNYCYYNHFDDGCSDNVIWNDVQPTSSNKLQNINVVRGVSGTESSCNFINIVEKNAAYEIKVAKNSKGKIKIYCEADLIA